MDAAQSDDGVREDEDGRYWIDLTRRQTLGGLGALGAVVMAGLGAAQSAEVIGGERSTVGGEFRVREELVDEAVMRPWVGTAAARCDRVVESAPE